ncbi:RICIN domain-containing protein [Adlercreutzia sp. ZJ176]|nr:RICIN domain-containing protein [Adlercreutzia sp. ZJ176]
MRFGNISLRRNCAFVVVAVCAVCFCFAFNPCVAYASGSVSDGSLTGEANIASEESTRLPLDNNPGVECLDEGASANEDEGAATDGDPDGAKESLLPPVNSGAEGESGDLQSCTLDEGNPPSSASNESDSGQSEEDSAISLDHFDDQRPVASKESTAQGEETPVKDGVYTIHAYQSASFVVDVTGASPDSGANIELWSSNCGDWQRFMLTSDGLGFYDIVCVSTGKSLDVAWASKEPGANVIQWAPNGQGNQKWRIRCNFDGSYTFISALSGLVLDVAYGRYSDGANIIVWEDTGSLNQRFALTEFVQPTGSKTLADGAYIIQSALDSSLVFDVTSASKCGGAKLELWQSNQRSWQKFKVTYTNDGMYEIAALHSGLSLDVYDAARHVGAPIIQWSKNGNANQRWILVADKDGYYRILSHHSGLALGVQDVSARSGSSIAQWVSDGSRGQLFRFVDASVLQEGYYSIAANADDRLVFDVANASSADGAQVILWTDRGSLWQRWLLSHSASGSFKLASTNYGKELVDLPKGDESLLAQWGSDSSAAVGNAWRLLPSNIGGWLLQNTVTQKFVCSSAGLSSGSQLFMGLFDEALSVEFIPVSTFVGDGAYQIVSSSNRGIALDVSGGSVGDGAKCVFWSKGASKEWQKFYAVNEGDYVVRFMSCNSGKALDVVEASGLVNQWAWHNGSNQRWKILPDMKGGYTIISLSSGRALAFAGDTVASGSSAVVSGRNGSLAQSFMLEPARYVSPAEKINNLLSAASSYIGTYGGARFENAMLSAGGTLINGSRGYWCQDFVWYVFRQAGLEPTFAEGLLTSYPQEAYYKYKSLGKITWSPRRGDLVFNTWAPFPGGEYVSHVGIVESVHGGYVTVIEGNMGNRVVRNSYSIWSSSNPIMRGFARVNYGY